MKNLKGNNKGFSLVELIVVIAIMGILAVTLAPRLTEYVEKARKSADQEVVNAIYTAVKFGVLDDAIAEDAVGIAGTTAYQLNDLDNSPSGTLTGLYNVTGKDWVEDAACTYLAASTENLMVREIQKVVGNFRLKSSEADAASTISVKVDTVGNNYVVTVVLDYDGTANVKSRLTASDDSVRP